MMRISLVSCSSSSWLSTLDLAMVFMAYLRPVFLERTSMTLP